MGGLFSSDKEEPKKPERRGMSDADKNMLKVKGQKDKLKQYQRRTEGQITKARGVAKQLAQAGKKREAMLVLKQKKALEKNLSSAQDQLFQIEQMISSIETAAMQAEFVENLARSNETLKGLHEQMGGLEGVERIMEETQEAHDLQEEINAALEGQLDAADEEDVMEQLRLLEEEEAAVRPAPPAAPTARRPIPFGMDGLLGSAAKRTRGSYDRACGSRFGRVRCAGGTGGAGHVAGCSGHGARGGRAGARGGGGRAGSPTCVRLPARTFCSFPVTVPVFLTELSRAAVQAGGRWWLLEASTALAANAAPPHMRANAKDNCDPLIGRFDLEVSSSSHAEVRRQM